jgi:hypothetical protein
MINFCELSTARTKDIAGLALIPFFSILWDASAGTGELENEAWP